jgi:hypothetical protein
MLMILLQVSLVSVNYGISGQSIMRFYLPVIVLLTGILVHKLKARRFVKRHKNSSKSDL